MHQEQQRVPALSDPSLESFILKLVSKDPQAPLLKLYRNTDANHLIEGSAVIPALYRYLEELRACGISRISNEALSERIEFMCSYAAQCFNEVPTVEAPLSAYYPERGSRTCAIQAVCFYGSYLRGKVAAGDIDIKIAIPYQEPRYVLDFLMGYNESQEAVHTAFKQSTLRQLVHEGDRQIPIKFEADSSFGEGNDLSLLTAGPYLVIMRDETGSLRFFASFSETKYLEKRDP